MSSHSTTGPSAGSKIGSVRQKAFLTLNELSYCRELHVVAMPRDDAQPTYDALIQAFKCFGGIPATELVDNQKSAVFD